MTTRLLLVLALLSAASPIATDLYLASFPEVAHGLHTDAAGTQLTLTAFLVGLGIGQPLWGPVSDRFGRWRPLLVGSSISTVAALAAALSPNIEALVAARFVQAVAAASGIVIARAVIADLVEGFAAARSMTLMMTATSTAPIVAPVIGGALAGHLSWRGVLGVVSSVMILQLLGVITTVPETLPVDRRSPRLGYGHLVRLLRRRAFVLYAATQAFTFGALMGYISNSSLVYQTVFGASGLVYGLGFAGNAVASTLGGAASARLARRQIHPARTVQRALPVLVIASAAVLVAAVSPWPVLVVVPVFAATAAVGLTMGNCASLAIEQVRDAAGAGSAVLGGLMFLVGALASPVGGLIGGESAVPMGLAMLGASGLALGSFTLARRQIARIPDSEAAFTAR